MDKNRIFQLELKCKQYQKNHRKNIFKRAFGYLRYVNVQHISKIFRSNIRFLKYPLYVSIFGSLLFYGYKKFNLNDFNLSNWQIGSWFGNSNDSIELNGTISQNLSIKGFRPVVDRDLDSDEVDVNHTNFPIYQSKVVDSINMTRKEPQQEDIHQEETIVYIFNDIEQYEIVETYNSNENTNTPIFQQTDQSAIIEMRPKKNNRPITEKNISFSKLDNLVLVE
ncbi:MAG TPA: hypothetical protein EYO61_05520, partial [Campylobacterales bacterium]|nr:hypothetical protein [Campylobacterales bacterium]